MEHELEFRLQTSGSGWQAERNCVPRLAGGSRGILTRCRTYLIGSRERRGRLKADRRNGALVLKIAQCAICTRSTRFTSVGITAALHPKAGCICARANCSAACTVKTALSRGHCRVEAVFLDAHVRFGVMPKEHACLRQAALVGRT